MAVASREASSLFPTLTVHVQRGIELLWLLTAATVPLIFVPKEFMLSEAVNAYVEVPKTTALRTLIGIMTILWIVEWVLKGGLNVKYSISRWPTKLKDWLTDQPSRWVVVAATAYIIAFLISTAFSGNFWVSVWGEVSAQFGYSAYTTVSYFLLFVIIATHLKTRPQLWRLLGVIVVTGTLVAFYGIIQHYNLDPLHLGETGSIRVTAMMANAVFTGATLVITSLMTLGVGLAVLNTLGWSPLRIILWGALIAAQLIAVYWTGSRSSWLLGMPLGLLAILILPVLAQAISTFLRSRALLVDLLWLLWFIVVLGLLVLLGQLFMLNLVDLSMLRILFGFVGLLGFLSVLMLLVPGQFTEGALSFAKSFLVVGSGLVILLLVDSLTPAPARYPALDLRDLPGLPDPGILLALLGLLGSVATLSILLPTRFPAFMRYLAKPSLVLASGLLITLIVITIGPATSTAPAAAGSAAASAAEEQVSTIAPPTRGRGLSYRTDIWSASAALVVDRPWFEYEGLSWSLLRPLVGYGPELFKYTFPLESPLGGLLSHAHNFFLHHAVEEGILGLFSSIGLFAAFFIVGVAQLLRN